MRTFSVIILLGVVFGRINAEEPVCRMSNASHPMGQFTRLSCWNCHDIIRRIQHGITYLNITFFEVEYPALLDDPAILASFTTTHSQQLWRNCCRRAYECCHQNNSIVLTSATTAVGVGCLRTWDGLLCWEPSQPGHTARQLCPDVWNACPDREAQKECTQAGQWFTKDDKQWTNYGACSQLNPERPNLLALGAYSLSLVTLVPALLIFQFFSALHCFRVVLHKNLMLSLILHCVVEISFLSAFLLPSMAGDDKISLNGDGCRLLRSASVYLTVSNFMWVLCEGLLLHRQLSNTFAEEARKWIFFSIGWGLPCVPLLVLVSYRLTSDDVKCWSYPSGIDWVWKIPCLLSLLMNCVFFAYILTVVVRTLSRQTSDNVVQFRNTVRAGLVLVPLFGLHSVLMMYRPLRSCTIAEEYYSYALRLVEGLQGCIVAVTYCYVNSEVRAALKRTWRNLVDMQALGQGQANYTSALSTQTVL